MLGQLARRQAIPQGNPAVGKLLVDPRELEKGVSTGHLVRMGSTHGTSMPDECLTRRVLDTRLPPSHAPTADRNADLLELVAHIPII